MAAASSAAARDERIVSQIVSVVADIVRELERNVDARFVQVLEAQSATNTHLAKINGTVADLVRHRDQQVVLNQRHSDCISELSRRVAVLEEVSRVQHAYIERAQEEQEERGEKRHEWTVGQIIALAGAVSGLTALINFAVSLLFK